MRKELGTFKRTAQKDFTSYFIIILVAFLLFLAFVFGYKISEASATNVDLKMVLNEISNMGRPFFMGWVMTLIILINVMPPDFQYDIIVDAGCILFQFPNGIHKVISHQFVISKKTMYSLVLEDKEIAKTIEIPYNRKVLEVLKEIQKK